MKICAVVPAAGKGSRLQLNIPKILLPLSKTETLWSLLREKLLLVADHINVIASPTNVKLIEKTLSRDISAKQVSISIQPEPIGMGDAIFCGYPIWKNAERLLIVWGDQAFVSQTTLSLAVITHAGSHKTIALPLVTVTNPYVEYIFKKAQLALVKETREGAQCNWQGLTDVGTFVLSVQDLLSAWNNYLKSSSNGAKTGEINFLPFLAFLSANDWLIQRVSVTNPLEARGINTLADFNFLLEHHKANFSL